jgi:hypothetical protein
VNSQVLPEQVSRIERIFPFVRDVIQGRLKKLSSPATISQTQYQPHPRYPGERLVVPEGVLSASSEFRNILT